MSKNVKIGVVGVGHLGKYHVKHYSKIGDVELVGIYDIDNLESNKIAEQYGIRSFVNMDEMIRHVDAVSIVTPTKMHYDIAKIFLKEKKHVLIEKPITRTVNEAD